MHLLDTIEPCAWRRSLAAALLAASTSVCAAQDLIRSGPLFDELARMDKELFDAAFVNCDAAKFRALFTEDAEFYHDRTGAAVGEAARTMRSCPRDQGVTRTLLAGSLEVYAMQGYGAIQIGSHRFARQGEPGSELAKFVHLWKRENGGWRLARVLSFDHRPAPTAATTTQPQPAPTIAAEEASMPVKIAVIQKPPVLLDRDRSIAQALAAIAEAAAGATLLVFPEAYLPGYPIWIWRLRPGGDMQLASDLHALLRQNAIDLQAEHLRPLQEAARRHGLSLLMGLNEIDSRYSGTTLFNTLVLIGPDGQLLNRHRKLMPTNPERMVWGMGDASGLRVVDTPAGRLGALICWESYMPLARYSLYAQDLEIFINPTWDKGESCLLSLRHIAKEAGCWVIGTATALQGLDLPASFPERDRLYQADEWINDGDAVVINPSGAVLAGPLHREKGILYAEIDVEAARRARRSLDVCGHYARPDIFSLAVNRRPLPPVDFSD